MGAVEGPAFVGFEWKLTPLLQAPHENPQDARSFDSAHGTPFPRSLRSG